MAKKKANKSKQPQAKPEPEVPEVIEEQEEEIEHISFSDILKSPYIPYLLIFFFSSAIYFNTLFNQYTLDDTLVLRSNKYTLKGFAGIKDLMTHDAFVGFWGDVGGQLVSGGRYRPLSMVTLAVEVQLFGQKPAISHLINILLFSLTCIVLYQLLRFMLPPPRKKDTPFYFSIPFIATMIFAGHPIHTEVVANIKGRDEIMALLFALWALYAGLKYVKTRNMLHLVWGSVMLFLGLLSKENVVMFMAVIPFSYYFFTNAGVKNYLITIAIYLIPVALFLFLRDHYTKSAISSESSEILNNSFAYVAKNSDGTLQKYAIIIMTFILYFKLLIFPHPLTHDYNYNQIPIIGPSDPVFMLSFLVCTALGIYALVGLPKKTLPSYAILYYFTTFIIVSNLFFPLGTLMNERFAYMSSIGFSLIVGWLFVKVRDRFKLPISTMMMALSVILVLYSFKTITRNPVWYDNLTLFLVDCKTSNNGAKVQLATGVELEDLADRNFIPLRQNGYLQKITDLMDMNVNVTTIPDSTMRKELLKKALTYIDRSLQIYPTRYGAWLVKGNTAYKLNKDAKEAIRYYDSAVFFSGNADYESLFDEAVVEIDNEMPAKAIVNLQKAMLLKPDDFQTMFYLGTAYAGLNNGDSATYWFKKCLVLNPKDAQTYYKIGSAYGKQLGNLDTAIVYFKKAIALNPNVPLYYEDLGVAFGFKDMPDSSIRISEECLKKFPEYTPAIKNIAISYNKKGDTAKGHEYEVKAAQILAQKH